MASLMIDGLVSGHHGLQVRPRRSVAASVRKLSPLLMCALIVTSLVPGARADAGAGSDRVKAPSAMQSHRWLVECADGSSHAVSSIDEMPDIMASRQTECIIKPLLAATHAGLHSPPTATLRLLESPSWSSDSGSTAELAAEVTDESARPSPARAAARAPPLSGDLQRSATVHAHETDGRTGARGESQAKPSDVGQTATQPGDDALTHSDGMAGRRLQTTSTYSSPPSPLLGPPSLSSLAALLPHPPSPSPEPPSFPPLAALLHYPKSPPPSAMRAQLWIGDSQNPSSGSRKLTAVAYAGQ